MLRFRSLILLIALVAIGLSACSLTTVPAPLPPTTLVAESPASNLLLLDNGLGPFRFGDNAEAVIEGISATIGGWNADSMDGGAILAPICAQGPSRVVSWGSLILTFVARDGHEAFTSWAYGFDPMTGNSDDNRQLDLATPEGIGLGSVRNDLIDTYGTTVAIVDDTTLDTAVFVVTGTGPTRLGGKLDSVGPAGTVDFLETTPEC